MQSVWVYRDKGGMSLKTLQEHDAEVSEAYAKLREQHTNGIACPECGKELLDSNPGIVLTSYPPQKNIHCPACGWRGYRFC